MYVYLNIVFSLSPLSVRLGWVGLLVMYISLHVYSAYFVLISLACRISFKKKTHFKEAAKTASLLKSIMKYFFLIMT